MAINLGNNHPPSSHLTSKEFLDNHNLPADLQNIGNYILFCCGQITKDELLKTATRYQFITEEKVAA